MPNFSETKILPHQAKQLFDMVLDIEKYPQFLPWCKLAKITKIIDDNNLEADLLISFKGFMEKYSSKVIHQKISQDEYEIEVIETKGPFKYLVNKWHFKDLGQNQCQVNFFIDFKFNSIILEKMIGLVFEKATRKMMSAFEERALQLYKSS